MPYSLSYTWFSMLIQAIPSNLLNILVLQVIACRLSWPKTPCIVNNACLSDCRRNLDRQFYGPQPNYARVNCHAKWTRPKEGEFKLLRKKIVFYSIFLRIYEQDQGKSVSPTNFQRLVLGCGQSLNSSNMSVQKSK